MISNKSKRFIFKRLTLFLLALMVFTTQLCGSVIMPAVAAAPDAIIEKYSCEKNGDIYDISLIVKNMASTDITDVYILIGNSSFTVKDKGSLLDVAKTITPNNTGTARANFTFDGVSNKLPLTIMYTKNSTSYEQTDTVTITEAKIKDTTTTPTDSTKFAPKIVIANNSAIPSAKIGEKIVYTLPLKNNSIYAARNISVTPVLDDSTPLDVEAMNISQTIEAMQPNEAKNIKFEFTVSSGAQAKKYPIKFNLQYYNYSSDYFSSTETAYLKLEEGSSLPKLVLKDVSTNPSPVHAGEKFKLNVTVENVGAATAKTITASLSGLKNDGASIIGTTNKKTEPYIYGNNYTKTFTFDLVASKKIEIGTNSLKIQLSYKDASGATFSDEMEFFYNVQDTASSSNVEFKNISAPSGSLKPGDNALISFNAVNTGTADAKNVKVSISSDKEIIPRTQNTVIIPLLKKGETKNIQFQLFISDEAVTKNYPVSLAIEYDTDNSGTASKQSVSQYVGLYVENKTGKSVPRLIIDKFSIDPKVINAGEEFTLNLSILNTSKASTINNVKVTVSSDDGTFTTVDSNSFYIDSISPKATISKNLKFSSKPDAPAKQYNISVNYEYEDEKGSPYTSKDSIGVTIQQLQRLVLGDFSIPTEAFIGNPIPLNISFYNMGKSTLYNFMVKLEGKFKAENGNYYVGNFEPGKTDSYDGTIIPEAPGPLTGNILFTYEDSNGKTQVIKKPISINVAEMPQMDPNAGGEMPVMPEKAPGKKIPLWAYIAGGVVLVVIVLIVILVVRKKIKARKDLMFDEEI